MDDRIFGLFQNKFCHDLIRDGVPHGYIKNRPGLSHTILSTSFFGNQRIRTQRSVRAECCLDFWVIAGKQVFGALKSVFDCGVGISPPCDRNGSKIAQNLSCVCRKTMWVVFDLEESGS